MKTIGKKSFNNLIFFGLTDKQLFTFTRENINKMSLGSKRLVNSLLEELSQLKFALISVLVRLVQSNFSYSFRVIIETVSRAVNTANC